MFLWAQGLPLELVCSVAPGISNVEVGARGYWTMGRQLQAGTVQLCTDRTFSMEVVDFLAGGKEVAVGWRQPI